MLQHLELAWATHARDCEQRPHAILLNPGNHKLIGWDEVFGLPVLPDERVQPKRLLLVCGAGYGGYCAEGVVIWDERGEPHALAEPVRSAH